MAGRADLAEQRLGQRAIQDNDAISRTMIVELKSRQSEIAELCQRYGVCRLDVFGSAAVQETFDPNRSDLDLLVEFAPHSAMGPADQYFGLLADLQQLFQRQVDLVSTRGLRNPYFIEAVNRTKQVLYAS